MIGKVNPFLYETNIKNVAIIFLHSQSYNHFPTFISNSQDYGENEDGITLSPLIQQKKFKS